MSGGGDPWLLGLNRPMWAIRGRASLPACRYRGPWFRKFVRPIGAASDARHSAAFVGNLRATCWSLVSPLVWVEVTILNGDLTAGNQPGERRTALGLSSLVWKLDRFTPNPNVFKGRS